MPRGKLITRLILCFVTAFLLLSSLPSSVIAQDRSDLTITYVESRAAEGKYAYDVSVLFSLLDSSGLPVKDLKLEDISVSEDGQALKPDSLALVETQPISLALLIDTSGSMTGSKIAAARAATSTLINGLKPNDRISITSFNNEVSQLSDFSSDLTAVKNLVGGIEAIPQAGTCLYDAAYQAIQRISALPQGRRAVIVLTDGKDEKLEGGVCSKVTLDDVIDLATEGTIRVPVYTIALGDLVDTTGLMRLAELTGGRFEAAPQSTTLEALFLRLLDQLQSQYVLGYTSTSAAGNHNLALSVNYLNSNLTDSRGFMLQPLPLYLTIITPTSNQTINQKVKIAVAVDGQGKPVKQVIFNANGVTIGTDDTAPYELEWLPDEDFNGTVELAVSAVDDQNQEIAKSAVLINVTMPGAVKVPQSKPVDFKLTEFLTKDGLFLFGGILLGIIAGVVVLLVLTSKKRREEKRRDKQWNDMVVNPPDSSRSTEMTMDGFIPSPDALGVLTVLQSDDPSMLGQRFEIRENSTRLGRAADNDILFPKDSPVSRHHAIIENRNGKLVLSEMISPAGDGTMKPPTFGTFVNDQPLSKPADLHNNDMIRLGKRVLIKFETAHETQLDDARTLDQIDPVDHDQTREM